jgi:cyclopropane-fatty-acyl-phospholipid synthase
MGKNWEGFRVAEQQTNGLAIDLVERGFVPDFLVRRGMRRMLRNRLRQEEAGTEQQRVERAAKFIESCRSGPIALQTDKANEQHYEVPAALFERVLGRHLKYSGCHWGPDCHTLDDAEASALAISCERAELDNGQRILELGCGWGSLSLWMAEHYPGSEITAVSNSASQREFIEGKARERGLGNLNVVTADMNEFSTDGSFDRVVSIEMFEHMRNYQELLSRIAGWLAPGGKLFVHIFCHRRTPYAFETQGAANWIGRYFFSGGTMPSDDLFSHFQNDLNLKQSWRWNGHHYGRTSNAWLAKMDAARSELLPLFEATYGAADANRWINRWRMFFMACAELFDYHDGDEWWVSHYLFEKPV